MKSVKVILSCWKRIQDIHNFFLCKIVLYQPCQKCCFWFTLFVGKLRNALRSPLLESLSCMCWDVWPFEFLNFEWKFHIGYSCIEFDMDSILIESRTFFQEVVCHYHFSLLQNKTIIEAMRLICWLESSWKERSYNY